MNKLQPIILSLSSIFFIPGLALADTCVSIAGTHLDPAEIYDSRHQCGTCPGQAAQPNLCGALNRIMVPYWSAPADVVAIPHRGLWGQPLGNGAAENTLAAAQAALSKGYRVIEIDAALTGPDAAGHRKVFLGHYFSMAAAGGAANKAPKDYNPEQLSAFQMRKRDQSLSFAAGDRLSLFSDVLAWAAQNQVLLMVDPKTPRHAEKDELAKIVAYVLNEARSTGHLANIAIKSAKTYPLIMKDMTPYLDLPYTSYEGQFLWSPIVNKFRSTSQDNTLAAVNAWHAGTNSSKQVMTYELNLFSPKFWGARKFTAAGTEYLNLIDYVKKLTSRGKRSAIWSVDPSGDKGKLNSLYKWKLVGNTVNDARGNPINTLSYDLARHLAFNTDRPDWYEGMVVNPY